MKKTLIALVALAGVAMGAEGTVTDASELTWTALTLTSPANNQLTSSNSAIDWSEETGNLTESWELSFTLDPSRVSNQYLFGTVKGGSGADGYTLTTTSAGAIALLATKIPQDFGISPSEGSAPLLRIPAPALCYLLHDKRL